MTSWTVTSEQTLPNGSLEPPISPTAYEALLACPLQLLYSRDPTFPRRSTPFARIGIAFHRTLELLPSALAHNEVGVSVRAALATFRMELESQRAAAAGNSRESDQPWPDGRVHHAEQALALLVHRVWSARYYSARSEPTMYAEISITSSDGLLRGVIDRVDRTDDGPVVVDYKSAESFDEAHLARFTRQLLLYAYLWNDAHGEWPVRGIIDFVLLGREISVPIAAAESLELIGCVGRAIESNRGLNSDRLATPGPACSRCDYRPWCAAYWRNTGRVAEAMASIEGVVASRASEAPQVVWLEHDRQASQLILDAAHLSRRDELTPGTRLRLIDAIVDGAPPVGRFRLAPQSEMWIVR